MWADKRFKQKWLLKYILNSEETETKTQGLHVLKKLSGDDVPVVKLVTDGHVSVPGEFTPAALHQFSQLSDSDGQVQWDRCWIIVKKYSLKFLWADTMERCSMRLLIENFSFWVSEEGFRLKEDPVPCLELLAVQSMVKNRWENQRQEESVVVEMSEAYSSEVSSVPLSALLSQMYKDSFNTQEAELSQSGGVKASERSREVSEVTTEAPLKCIAETPDVLSEKSLHDIRRFLISAEDVLALKAIPEWQPGYVVPRAEAESACPTHQQEKGEELSSVIQRLSKIRERTLAGGDSNAGSSNTQSKDSSDKCVSMVVATKPTPTNCNISVQVGHSLLSGSPEDPPHQVKEAPEMTECSAQVGNSLLNNSQLNQKDSQSQAGAEASLSLPSNFIFHPYFLGESNTNEVLHFQSAFKEPCLPARLQGERVKGAGDIEEESFVASTQIDREEGEIMAPRPDFAMSPVKNSQAGQRLRDFEMLSEVDLNTDSQSEPNPPEIKGVENDLGEKTSVMKEPATAIERFTGSPGHKSAVDTDSKTNSKKTQGKLLCREDLSSPMKDCVQLGASNLPASAYETCAEGLETSHKIATSTGGSINASEVNPIQSNDQTGTNSGALVTSTSVKCNMASTPNLVDSLSEAQLEKDSEENECPSGLSDLAQKFLTTPETSSSGGSAPGSQNSVVVSSSNSKVEEAMQNSGADVQDAEGVVSRRNQASSEANRYTSEIKTLHSDSVEDQRLHDLAKVSEHNNMADKSMEEKCGRDCDVTDEAKVQKKAPAPVQSPFSVNFGVQSAMFMGLNFPSPKKFSLRMSPEERRLEVMRQVIKSSEAHTAQKVDGRKEEPADDLTMKETEKSDTGMTYDESGSHASDDSKESSEQEDLIVEKVIRIKNRNSSGNASLDCSSSVVLKVEPVSDSEAKKDSTRTRKKQLNRSSVHRPLIGQLLGEVNDDGDTSIVVQVKIDASPEADGMAIDVIAEDGAQNNDTSVESFAMEKVENSGTDVTTQSSPEARECVSDVRQLADVEEDILTVDTLNSTLLRDQKQKRKTSLITRQSGKKQRKAGKVFSSDEEGDSLHSKKTLASVKKQVKARKPSEESEETNDDDWVPSPVKQGRPNKRASQPRFSFNKTKSVAENIQDMLTTKKSAELDSSVLFSEKIPKGKSADKRRGTQARRSSRKHRLYNEGESMLLLSEAPDGLQSVAEEAIKETGNTKVPTSNSLKVEQKLSPEMREGNSQSRKAGENEQVNSELPQQDNNKSERTCMDKEKEDNDDVHASTLEDISQSRTTPRLCLFAAVSDNVSEEGRGDIIDGSFTAEEKASSIETKTGTKEILDVSPIIVVQGGSTFHVSQPLVLLKSLNLSDTGDFTVLNEGQNRTLNNLNKHNINKSLLDTQGTDVVNTTTDDKNQDSVLNKSNALEDHKTLVPSTSENSNQQDVNTNATEHYYQSCDDAFAESEVSDSENVEGNVQEDSGRTISEPAGNGHVAEEIVEDVDVVQMVKGQAMRSDTEMSKGNITERILQDIPERLGFSRVSEEPPLMSSHSRVDFRSQKAGEAEMEDMEPEKEVSGSNEFIENKTNTEVVSRLTENSDREGFSKVSGINGTLASTAESLVKSVSPLKGKNDMKRFVNQRQEESDNFQDGKLVKDTDFHSDYQDGRDGENLTREKDQDISIVNTSSQPVSTIVEVMTTTDKSDEVIPISCKSSEEIPSPDKSSEVIPPTDESVSTGVSTSCGEEKAVSSQFPHGHEQDKFEECSPSQVDKLNSHTCDNFPSKCLSGENLKDSVEQLPEDHLIERQQLYKSPTITQGRNGMDSLPGDYTSNENKEEEKYMYVEKAGDQDSIEKLLEASQIDEISPPCGSGKNLTFPTPEMSLQCAQRSRQGEGHLSQIQGFIEAASSQDDADDLSRLCNLQKMLDEEIQREDEHHLLSISFAAKTQSALMSNFGLDH